MTESGRATINPESEAAAGADVDQQAAPGRDERAGEMEEYAGGYIKARHGHIPAWLLAVYAVLFAWALYYLVIYWGGLGPGLGN
jgi:hypothetical protein